MFRIASVLLAAAATVAMGGAFARSSDRSQPMDIEAGRQEGTFESDSTNILSGGVTISQGTLDIKAGRAEITLVGGDPSRAVLTGSPVVLRQQMDDGTPMTAHAAKIDYNLRTEVVVFTGDVRIEQPRGSMSGERVVYNMQTGRVESGGEGAGRVRMRILPRGARTPAGDATDAQDDAQDEG
ncbi:MAG TPA: lipopolysaccharide transport periplasmic protein LptA [Xanthomonadaceae bacterium]|nr:lipopolysaccharide transport periplasmic protein LptA [Xanthomonadaceae bacterium]